MKKDKAIGMILLGVGIGIGIGMALMALLLSSLYFVN